MNKVRIHAIAITTTLLLLSVGTASAQFVVLHTFTGGADGKNPYYGAPVVSGSKIYGTTDYGANGGGVVFAVNTDGTNYSALHTFTSTAPDGYNPLGTVVLSGSTLYGTTYYGGSGAASAGNGTVFAVNVDGTGYRALHSFDSTTTGYKPYGSVTVSGSTLYGMTYYSASGAGSIYSVSTDGNGFTTLHNFAGGASDGASPLGGSLTLSGSTFFGMAAHGGSGTSPNDGVAFAIGVDGSSYHDLVDLTGGSSRGANPYGSLTLVGSKLYGMTRIGGGANKGTVFSMDTDGSHFTTLYSFSGGTADGANPYGSLTSDGGLVLYGTTKYGGSANDGTVFEIDTDGSGFNVLNSFTGTADGLNPEGDLALANGALYGWTSAGGAGGGGTLFALSVPEPSTWALSAAGVGAFLLLLRVRRRRPMRASSLTVR